MNDDIIIEGCVNGDRKSQDELVHRFAPTLMAVCMRYTKDMHLAQDALQETFINVLRYIKKYSGKGSFEGWMRKIAVNCSYKIVKNVRPVRFDDDISKAIDATSVIPDVYSTLGEKELLQLLQKLPESQYLVFNMKVIEGLSHEEIADILNIGVSTSRSNLTRARINLIRMIEENEEINYLKLGNY